MKTNVIHEDHSEYTEHFPFIFHFDIITRSDVSIEVSIENHKIDSDCCETHLFYQKCPVNWHKNMEILYFKEGHARLSCGSEIYDALPGMVYIINPNFLHTVSTDTGTKYYCLIVDKDFCTQNDMPTDSIVFTNRNPQDPVAVSLFNAVAEAFSTPKDPLRSLRVRAAVLSLLCCLCDKHAVLGAPAVETDRSVAPIKAAIRYIDQNLTHRMTLDEIAAAAGISKYYFANEFRRAVGSTCVEYINTLRCQHAKALLATGDYTVSEVCFLCGFENLSYFSKTFFRYTGSSPSSCKKTKKRTAEKA